MDVLYNQAQMDHVGGTESKISRLSTHTFMYTQPTALTRLALDWRLTLPSKPYLPPDV